MPLWRVGSTYPAPASFGAHGSCGQRPDDHRGQMESPASFLDSGESLGSESPEGWRRAQKLLCKPNARGQSIAEGNKLDGTPIGKRTLTRPSRRHFARKAYGPWMESPRISQGPGKARIPRCAPHPGYKADVAESKKWTRIANRNFSAHRLTCTKRPGGLKMLGVARSKNELL